MNLKLITLIVGTILLLGTVKVNSNTNKFNPQKFETTFTITYNSIDLVRAAELEKEIKEKYGDACRINITLKSVSTATSGALYLAPTNNTLEGSDLSDLETDLTGDSLYIHDVGEHDEN